MYPLPDDNKLNWRQLAQESALFAWAGIAFGVPFGAGCYLGWHLIRGLVRLLGE